MPLIPIQSSIVYFEHEKKNKRKKNQFVMRKIRHSIFIVKVLYESATTMPKVLQRCAVHPVLSFIYSPFNIAFRIAFGTSFRLKSVRTAKGK